MKKLIFTGILSVFIFAHCLAFNITSDAFVNHGQIPIDYTCYGDKRIPQLTWSEAPLHTQSFALIVYDPDAPSGTWYHWLIYNIPATTHKLSADKLPEEVRALANSWRRFQYDGPCPPSGEHRYIWKLFALDQKLNLPYDADVFKMEDAMKNHILASASLEAKYKK